MKLTHAQLSDLTRCVERYDKTVGTYDYPRGDAIRLRTGPTLARAGLVECANVFSANRHARWLPTAAGRKHLAEFRMRLEIPVSDDLPFR